MERYNTEYNNYSNHITVMVSTDRLILNEKSSVRARMVEYSKLYKELHIIVFSKKKIEPITIADNCTIYSTDSLVRFNYVSDACKIGKKILKKVDKEALVLVSCQDVFETALVGKCLANLKKNSQLLLQIHTDLYSPYFISSKIGYINALLNRIRLFISRFTIPHAQVIRVVSNRIADSLVQRGVDKDRIIVKPIDVNVEYIKSAVPSFNLKQKYPQFKKIILMVSRIESEKNIDLAIEAMGIVKAQISDIGLVIVGSGRRLESLKRLSYKLKLEDIVVFEGWQTDLVPYYKGCDIFLNTSFYEGYGMVLKEAEAAGNKIISTDVGIAREVGSSIADFSVKSVANEILKSI
jgi:glycosyltransferase involved in cell wall biosynthesis